MILNPSNVSNYLGRTCVYHNPRQPDSPHHKVGVIEGFNSCYVFVRYESDSVARAIPAQYLSLVDEE